MNPESLAGKELNRLIKIIPIISTKDQLDKFIKYYQEFIFKFNDFLKEKTIIKNPINLNKRKWFYTHSNVRSANYQLKHNLPCFFKYLSNSSIPKTTNLLEGGINSPLQELIHRHRGLTLDKQKVLIKIFLSSKQ